MLLSGLLVLHALEHQLVCKAALAAERVLEEYKRNESDAGEDDQEPERRAPVEALRQGSADYGPQ